LHGFRRATTPGSKRVEMGAKKAKSKEEKEFMESKPEKAEKPNKKRKADKDAPADAAELQEPKKEKKRKADKELKEKTEKKSKKGKKEKKEKRDEVEVDEVAAPAAGDEKPAVDTSLALDNFELSPSVKAILVGAIARSRSESDGKTGGFGVACMGPYRSIAGTNWHSESAHSHVNRLCL
jgi:hypothetical protein